MGSAILQDMRSIYFKKWVSLLRQWTIWKWNYKNNFIHNSIKRIKYLVINLTRVQNPYSENYKWLLKVIKGNLDNWEDIQCSLIGRLNIIKMAIFPNWPTVSVQLLLKSEMILLLKLTS